MRIQTATFAAAGIIFLSSIARAADAPPTSTPPAPGAITTTQSITPTGLKPPPPLPVTKPSTAPATANATTKATTAAATDSATTTASIPAATTGPADMPNPPLALRLSDLAGIIARSPKLTPAVWSASAALLEASTRLDSEDVRYRRLLVDAFVRSGNSERAATALAEYRKLAPEDHVAMIQQVDFNTEKMETAEAKVEYLRNLIGLEKLDPTVRSHAAVLCCQIMVQRGEEDIAQRLLDQALELNPQNIAALQLRYQKLAQGSPEVRLAGLLALVRANPAQPLVLQAVAREAAEAGLVGPSMKWFETGLNCASRTGSVDVSAILDFAAEIYLSNDLRSAQQIAMQVTAAQPENMGGWMVQLAIARSINKDAYAKLQQQATVAMGNRLAILRKAAGDTTATTRPLDTPDAVALPNPADDIQKIQASGHRELLADYAAIAGDIAWMRIYFDAKPAEAMPWITALRGLLPADNVTVPRLEGWAMLQSGKPQEAKARLEPIAERDPLAALGLVLLSFSDPAQAQKAMADGRKLLDQNPSGLLGTIIVDALGSRGLRVIPGPNADVIKAQLDKFPMEWLRILDFPQDFYAVRVEPVRSLLNFGEPMYVEITIQNVNSYDLTIGDDGVIHPDLWFDARFRGAANQQFPAVAYDRMGQDVLLAAHGSVSQIVRLDQGDLARTLAANPSPTLHVTGSIITNPSSNGNGVGFGPAGSRSNLTGIIQRGGSPINVAQIRQKIIDTLSTGEPGDKVRMIDLLTTYAQLMSGEGAPDDSKKMAQTCIELVQRAANDLDPSVRAWAWYLTTLLSGGPNRPPNIEHMLKDDAWQMRLLGLMVVQQSGQSREAAKALAANETDETVKRFAIAVMTIPPATQPAALQAITTQPAATQPAATPPAPAGAGAAPATPSK